MHRVKKNLYYLYSRWGQIGILACLVNYKPIDYKEAIEIVERVSARLQHANASLVLSAIRIIMVYMTKYLKNNEEVIQPLIKKMSAPLGNPPNYNQY